VPAHNPVRGQFRENEDIGSGGDGQLYESLGLLDIALDIAVMGLVCANADLLKTNIPGYGLKTARPW